MRVYEINKDLAKSYTYVRRTKSENVYGGNFLGSNPTALQSLPR